MVGLPAKDRTLQCKPGTWTGNPTFTYQWLLDGASLRGRTDPSYRVRGRDVGHVISCRVTARNASGTATATSKGVPAALDPEDFGLPSGDRCIKASRLKVRLKAPGPARTRSLEVYVDRHRRLAVRGGALPAVRVIRRLPARRFVLGVRALHRNGGWAHAAETYDRCS